MVECSLVEDENVGNCCANIIEHQAKEPANDIND